MDTTEYIKKFLKFILAIQAVGLLVFAQFQHTGGDSTIILFLILGLVVARFFFHKVEITRYLYTVSTLIYLIICALIFLPAYLGVEFFQALLLWDVLFGITLVIIILGKKYSK